MTEAGWWASEYRNYGYAWLGNAMDYELAREIEVEAQALFVEGHGIHREGIASKGGHSSYDVLDGFTVKDRLPLLWGWYYGILPLVEEITDERVICSPYRRSAVNVKRYKGSKKGTQGWHFDTNPISVLLFLSAFGAPLQLNDLNGQRRQILPVQGGIVVFQGRKILHHVPGGESARMTAPMNFYTPTDCERPDWIDKAIYENQDPPRLT